MIYLLVVQTSMYIIENFFSCRQRKLSM